MTRLIDADALDSKYRLMRDVETGDLLIAIADVTIDAQPTIDAEPVRHGKWEMKPDPFGFFDEIPVCSECGCTTKIREKTKYCPNCGARMDEE